MPQRTRRVTNCISKSVVTVMVVERIIKKHFPLTLKQDNSSVSEQVAGHMGTWSLSQRTLTSLSVSRWMLIIGDRRKGIARSANRPNRLFRNQKLLSILQAEVYRKRQRSVIRSRLLRGEIMFSALPSLTRIADPHSSSIGKRIS